jgi:methylphosphotriester-DNA--protein-cysteine methyltransferase
MNAKQQKQVVNRFKSIMTLDETVLTELMEKLPEVQQEALTVQAVRMVQAGGTAIEAAKTYGIPESRVRDGFKRYVGMTATQYRKKQKEQA